MLKKNPELPTIIDLDESVNALQLRTDEKVLSANERLKNIYETTCCYCLENKKSSPTQPNDGPLIQYHKMEIYNKLTKQIDTEIIDTHLLCSECVEKYKSEYESKKEKEKQINATNSTNDNKKGKSIEEKNKNLKNQNIEVDYLCGICDKTHFIILKTDENRQNKKACCAGCSIF